MEKSEELSGIKNVKDYNQNDNIRLTDKPLQVIYYGAPGTGKSFKIDNDEYVTDDNTVRTTFHPDTDYSTFVGAYKPTMEEVPLTVFDGTSAHYAEGKGGHPGTERKIVYKYVPQAFLKAYVNAWKDLANPYFLVIEEINRGNCAQIFGDLFQLLDRNSSGSSSYAIHADEDIARFLHYDGNGFANIPEETANSIRRFELKKDNKETVKIGEDILSGKKLLLPPNLYIWATMNTSDQSLFPIDSAFKRRWDWEYIPIDYHARNWMFEACGKYYLWSDFLKLINPKIYDLTQSSDKKMGYFFVKPDRRTDNAQSENNLISERMFLNKVLFYLWTDVLKDYEPSDEIFRDSDTKQFYHFDDFFPVSNGKLSEFVGKLELEEVTEFSQSMKDVMDSEDESKEGGTKPKYSVDGAAPTSMIDTVMAVLTKYFNDSPEISTEEVVDVWNNIGLPKHALETPEEFSEREDATKNRASKKFEAPDGRVFYVSTQLRKQHMDKLMIFAESHNIKVKRISE